MTTDTMTMPAAAALPLASRVTFTRTSIDTAIAVEQSMPVLTLVAAVEAGLAVRELGPVGGIAGVLAFVVLLAAVYGGEQR